nr:methyltransferase [Actinomadura rubrisoli]
MLERRARGGADHGPGDLHAQRLLYLTCGPRLAAVVTTLAELGIVDLVADEPRTAAELAETAQADPDALYRLLRCAASVGILAERPDGRFASTPLAEGMRADRPYSLLPLVLHSAQPYVTGPYSALTHSIRTGEPATVPALGSDIWRYFEEHPEAGARFDHTMTALGQWETDRHLDIVRPERFRRIADIGGGRGHFLAAALRRAPDASGVLFERPDVVAGADEVLVEQGVAGRVTKVAGDFFADPIPDGCDAYVLKAVLHNWPDERAERLLASVRRAIGDRDARLFVVEQVVSEGNRWDHAKFLDLDMLVLFGGRERRLDEWRGLFGRCGFELPGRPGEGHWTVLECRPTSVDAPRRAADDALPAAAPSGPARPATPAAPAVAGAPTRPEGPA